MLAIFHRLMARLFHGHHPAHAPIVLPAPLAETPLRPGIPDAYLDKLPPAEERHGDQHYTLDPVSPHFAEVADPHDHAAHH
jgi:hypothetical protein